MTFFSHNHDPIPLFLTSTSKIIPHRINNILFFEFNAELGVNPFVIYSKEHNFIFGYLKICNGSYQVKYEENNPVESLRNIISMYNEQPDCETSKINLSDTEMVTLFAHEGISYFKYNPVDHTSIVRNMALPEGRMVSMLTTKNKHIVCVLMESEKCTKILKRIPSYYTMGRSESSKYAVYYTFYFIDITTGTHCNYFNPNDSVSFFNGNVRFKTIGNYIITAIQDKENEKEHGVILFGKFNIYRTSLENIINQNEEIKMCEMNQKSLQIIPEYHEEKEEELEEEEVGNTQTRDLVSLPYAFVPIYIKGDEYILINKYGFACYVDLGSDDNNMP